MLLQNINAYHLEKKIYRIRKKIQLDEKERNYPYHSDYNNSYVIVQI
jgi:hypothetical protein